MARPRRQAQARPTPLVRPVADPRTFAQCRSMGHEWKHRGNIGADEKRPFNMYEAIGLVSVCTDCKTRRIKWITRSGEVISRYEHPDGYSLHGDEKLTTKQWRSSFVAVLFDTTNTQQGEAS